jgi:hypothetical protein
LQKKKLNYQISEGKNNERLNKMFLWVDGMMTNIGNYNCIKTNIFNRRSDRFKISKYKNSIIIFLIHVERDVSLTRFLINDEFIVRISIWTRDVSERERDKNQQNINKHFFFIYLNNLITLF